MNEMSPIDSLKGIGEKTRAVFERAGISDIGDLLHDYPRGYESYEPIMPLGEIYDKSAGAFYGEIVSPLNLRRVRRLTVVTGVIRDGTGTIQVTWFNMPYLKSSLVSGSRYVFRGKIVRKRQQMFLEQPAVFRMEEYEKLRGRLQPVYPLSEGLTTKMLQKAIRQALDEAELEKEYLPEEIRHKYNLAEYNYAIEEIHFPKDDHSMRLARHRLVFDEFLLFILAVRNLKEGREKIRPSFLLEKKEEIPKIIESLPFTLTGAQQKVWKELEADLTSSEVTARLILQRNKRFLQRRPAENINSHTCQIASGMLRFLFKFCNPSCAVRDHDTETAGLLHRNRHTGNRYICLVSLVVIQHYLVIHLVNMITG